MTILLLDAMAAAQKAALALTRIERAVINTLILADPPLGALLSDCNLIANVLAPVMEQASDAGAIVQLLSADAAMIAASATPNDAAPVFYAAAGLSAGALPAIASPARGRAAGLARMMCAAMEATWLGQAFCMEAQSNFTDRQSALDARNRIGAAMDATSDRIALAIGGDVFDLLAATARYATDFIVAEANDLAPIVVVDAGRSFPATALAYALYGDPSRAGELALRNRCGTPLFMPAVFEALAPTSSG